MCVRVEESIRVQRISLIPLCGEATEAITSIDLHIESLLNLILLSHSMAGFHLWARLCVFKLTGVN